MPRFSVILANLRRPTSFRTPLLSLPSRYSITSTSAPRPSHSQKPAEASPSISTRNEKLAQGSFLCCCGIVASRLRHCNPAQVPVDTKVVCDLLAEAAAFAVALRDADRELGRLPALVPD